MRFEESRSGCSAAEPDSASPDKIKDSWINIHCQPKAFGEPKNSCVVVPIRCPFGVRIFAAQGQFETVRGPVLRDGRPTDWNGLARRERVELEIIGVGVAVRIPYLRSRVPNTCTHNKCIHEEMDWGAIARKRTIVKCLAKYHMITAGKSKPQPKPTSSSIPNP